MWLFKMLYWNLCNGLYEKTFAKMMIFEFSLKI